MNNKPEKGRGAQTNPDNPFDKYRTTDDPEYLEYAEKEGENTPERTRYIAVQPKTIVNEVKSPDVGMDWSMNPYQGCEHGCAYCYARNSHEYWGYSAGQDFERIILYKENAADLLRAFLMKRSWAAEPIVLSGNTDCYQPIERKKRITRGLLETMYEFRNPVGIITKNSMITRDLDILEKMARLRLVGVSISITTLNEELRRNLEPRTASAKKKIDAVRKLSAAGVPVNIMMAPVIPGLNDHEIMDVAERTSAAGARTINYTTVRLNGRVKELFADWAEHYYPHRSKKIMNTIKELHGGSVTDSEFGRRMRGEGVWAEHIKKTFRVARERFNLNAAPYEYDRSIFRRVEKNQLRLF